MLQIRKKKGHGNYEHGQLEGGGEVMGGALCEEVEGVLERYGGV